MEDDQTIKDLFIVLVCALPAFVFLYLGITKAIRLYRAFGPDSADPEALALKAAAAEYKDRRVTEPDPRAYLAINKFKELKRIFIYLAVGANLLLCMIIYFIVR